MNKPRIVIRTDKYWAIRRDIDRIYIPTEYFSMRKTKKELFIMTLKRARNKQNKESE